LSESSGRDGEGTGKGLTERPASTTGDKSLGSQQEKVEPAMAKASAIQYTSPSEGSIHRLRSGWIIFGVFAAITFLFIYFSFGYEKAPEFEGQETLTSDLKYQLIAGEVFIGGKKSGSFKMIRPKNRG